MQETNAIPLPAPTVGYTLPVDKWRNEFHAFQSLRAGLLKDFSDQFVDVHQGQVIDSGPDDIALALKFFAEHGNVPVHIGLVTDKPESITRIPQWMAR